MAIAANANVPWLCSLRAATCATWCAAARTVFQWIPSSPAMIMLALQRPAARVHFLQQRQRVRVGFVIEHGRADVDDELLLGGELVEPLEQRQPGSRAQAPGILHERLRGDAQCLHAEARALEARLRLPQPRGGRGDLLRVLIRIQVDEGGDRPHRRIAGGRQGTPEQERAGEHAAPQP